jgi:NADPH:quinone reductase
MTTPSYLSRLQLRSKVNATGELELSLINVATPQPGPEEVVVRIEATPINPSDIGLLFGAADLGSAKASGTKSSPHDYYANS